MPFRTPPPSAATIALIPTATHDTCPNTAATACPVEPIFTLALADRRGDLLVREIAALRTAVARMRLLYPFHIDAWVVLPEHMHATWTLPDGDTDYSLRWTLIKRGFSAAIPAGESRSASRADKGERAIWQHRFWEHTVRDSDNFGRHLNYVHFNPVKHGLVAQASDWPHSSFSRAVARGSIRQIGRRRMTIAAGLERLRVGGITAPGFRSNGGVRKGTPPNLSVPAR